MAPRLSSQKGKDAKDLAKKLGIKESDAAKLIRDEGSAKDAEDAYNSKNGILSPHVNLNRLFGNYQAISVAQDFTTEPNKIGFHGIQAYFTDLNVAFDEPISLAVMEIVKCKTIGEMERDSFINGWLNTPHTPHSARSLDNIPAQTNHLTALRHSLATDQSFFRSIYRYSFDLLKPEGKRSIASDTAPDCWTMFFTSEKSGMQWRLLSDWLDFYEGPYKKKPVTKDLWNMVAELAFKTMEPGGESLGWWNEDSAWPAAIDDFVAWMKERERMDIS